MKYWLQKIERAVILLILSHTIHSLITLTRIGSSKIFLLYVLENPSQNRINLIFCLLLVYVVNSGRAAQRDRTGTCGLPPIRGHRRSDVSVTAHHAITIWVSYASTMHLGFEKSKMPLILNYERAFYTLSIRLIFY